MTIEAADLIGAREAANLFHMNYTQFINKIKELKIPGAKLGRSWQFYKPDLLAFFRSKYTINQQDISDVREKLCQSSKTQSRHIIKSGSSSTVQECRELRKQLLREKQKR